MTYHVTYRHHELGHAIVRGAGYAIGRKLVDQLSVPVIIVVAVIAILAMLVARRRGSNRRTGRW